MLEHKGQCKSLGKLLFVALLTQKTSCRYQIVNWNRKS